ncbi:MAG: hypothetical protein KAS23_05045 [Anaerohalosphaera sp.]|nr:hypothetical protein [Anaerohalosphaera sp.]
MASRTKALLFGSFFPKEMAVVHANWLLANTASAMTVLATNSPTLEAPASYVTIATTVFKIFADDPI